LETAINIAQIVVSIVLILLILAQNRSGGLGSAFGGDSGSIYHTRRGIEKTLFNFTIVTMIIFLALSIAATMVL
jgi:preprotein translocase subunit SecG